MAAAMKSVTETGIEVFTLSPTGQFKPPILSA